MDLVGNVILVLLWFIEFVISLFILFSDAEKENKIKKCIVIIYEACFIGCLMYDVYYNITIEESMLFRIICCIGMITIACIILKKNAIGYIISYLSLYKLISLVLMDLVRVIASYCELLDTQFYEKNWIFFDNYLLNDTGVCKNFTIFIALVASVILIISLKSLYKKRKVAEYFYILLAVENIIGTLFNNAKVDELSITAQMLHLNYTGIKMLYVILIILCSSIIWGVKESKKILLFRQGKKENCFWLHIIIDTLKKKLKEN